MCDKSCPYFGRHTGACHKPRNQPCPDDEEACAIYEDMEMARAEREEEDASGH